MNKHLTWKEENDTLIESLFLKRLDPKVDNTGMFTLELYITGECNQKCDYCYITNHREDIYPSKLYNHKTILNNMILLFDYIKEHKIQLKSIDIFSGDIWHTKFGLEVLQTLLDIIKNLEFDYLDIIIPSNMSFITDDKYLQAIEYYINSFRYYKVHLIFSCSNEGKIIDQKTRPCYNDIDTQKKDTDEYYQKLVSFCKKWNFGFHPMISASGIEYWNEQYIWWMDLMEKNFPIEQNAYDFSKLFNILMLEVRNDDWTFDKIQSYLSFLNTSIDYNLEKIFYNNVENLLYFTLGITNDNFISESQMIVNYSPFRLIPTKPGMNCAIERMACIRLGDLSWVPCHRTSYDKFIYGTFKLNKDKSKIIGMEAKNLPLLFSINTVNYKGHMKCDNCSISDYCIRGCYGAQYEANNELFYPCQTVCNLFFAKVLYLFIKSKDLVNKYKVTNKKIINRLGYIEENIINNIPKEEKEKWLPTVQNLIK